MKPQFLLIPLAIFLTACEDVRTEKYESGHVRLESRYEDGVKAGPEREFYESGALKRELNYEAGQRTGEARLYYETGGLEETSTYISGRLEGLVERFYKNGKLSYRAVYKDGKETGFPETFDESGEPATSGSFKDPRDGHSYEWIRIGNQVWYAENSAYAPASGSLCLQCNNWGRLYDFEAAKVACPEPFKLPGDSDWQELFGVAGKNPGTALKAGFGWDPVKTYSDYGNGTDSLGFAAKAGGGHFAKAGVPQGERVFKDAGRRAYFWSESGKVATFRHDSPKASLDKFKPEHGASARCVLSK